MNRQTIIITRIGILILIIRIMIITVIIIIWSNKKSTKCMALPHTQRQRKKNNL